ERGQSRPGQAGSRAARARSVRRACEVPSVGSRAMDGPTTGDAFGELLRLAHDGHDVLGVIERDDGLVEVHDPRIYFTGPDEWDALDRLACQRAVGLVLDVGC